MSNIIDEILESSKGHSGMTAADFFTENNPHGYFGKPEFPIFCKGIGKTNLQKFESFLEFVKEGIAFDNLPTISHDQETGGPCMWLNPRLAKSKPKLKLMLGGNLADFVKDYQYGKISPTFTLADLYREAVKDKTV